MLRVNIDPNVAFTPSRESRIYKNAAAGPSSPIGVICPRCSAYIDVPCAGEKFCAEREAANTRRMLELPTFAVEMRTPCCEAEVWLCWRTPRDDLEFQGVPCQKCGKTYTIRANASDWPMEARVVTERLHPHLLEVTCWAIR